MTPAIWAKEKADHYFREQCARLGPIEGIPVPPAPPMKAHRSAHDVWKAIGHNDGTSLDVYALPLYTGNSS